MRTRALLRTVAISTVLVLAMAACGNSGDDDDDAGGSSDNTTATTSGEADLTEERPGATRRASPTPRSRWSVIASKTNPLNGKYAELADGMNAYFDMVNDDGGIYGRQLKITKERDDVIGLQNTGAGAGEPRRGQRVRDVRRDAAVHRRRRARRGGSADVHVEHQPGDGRARQHLRQRARDLLRVRRPDRSLRRQAAGRHQGRRPRVRRRQPVEAVRAGHQGLVREVPDGRGRVLRRHDRVRRAEPQRPGRADEGRRASTSSRPAWTSTRSIVLAKEMQKQGLERGAAACRTATTRRWSRPTRDLLEGSIVVPAVRRVRAGTADPRDQDVPRADGEDREGAGRGRDDRLDPRRPARHRARSSPDPSSRSRRSSTA